MVIPSALGGCASVISGSSQWITVESNVRGAKVSVDGVAVGKTPFEGQVPRGKNVLAVEKPGYIKEQVQLKSETTSTFWANIIWGGLPGSTTDAATGAMHTYTNDAFVVNLMAYGDVMRRLKAQGAGAGQASDDDAAAPDGAPGPRRAPVPPLRGTD